MKRLTWLFLVMMLTWRAGAAVPDPVGLWEFDAADPSKAAIGNDLELVGSIEKIGGITADDGAIRIGENSYYICTHGIAPNGGGSMVNEWTLLIDFSYPASSMSDPPNGYNDLFQTDPTNVDDADWTINSSGAIGIGAVGYTGAHGYTTGPDTWYRMVVAIDNGTRHDIYVDGVEIFKGNQQGVDGRFALAEAILLFCAGYNLDGDDAPIDVSNVAIWDTPLTADDIAAMGLAGDRIFINTKASGPAPADGADDVLIDADLSWTPGEYAGTHDVYFSTTEADVEVGDTAALVAQGLARDNSSLAMDRLDFGQTYYWRVDEANAAPTSTVYEGNVWSFTTEPFVYPVKDIIATSNASSSEGQGPERLVDGSGLDENDRHSTITDDMWNGVPNADEPTYVQFEFDGVYKLYELLVWNYNMQFESVLGMGVKEATVEYSEDGIDWLVLGDVELAQATSSATYTANTVIPFDGVAAKYVRLTVLSTFSDAATIYGLSEVRFMYTPVQGRLPAPADGAVDVALDTTLSWRPGREAASHDVYLGTDPEALALAGTTTQNGYATTLDLDTTYYWQVVETNEVEAIGAWAGPIWSFTTQEYIVVDDFESYIDDPDAGDVIWEIWIDGWVAEGGDPDNGGSVVGNASSPFAEREIVHSGAQSMPVSFENTSASAISEVDLSFTPAEDWTARGIKTLSLWFYGAEGNAGQLYVKINDTKVLYSGDAGDIAQAAWQQFDVDLSTAGNVSNVTTLSVGVQGVGSGKILIDDIRLYGDMN